MGPGVLRLASALARENAALEREITTLRERIAELERSAATDSSTSSKPPASDALKKKSGTQRRTRSQRGTSGRPRGGQPGHKGTTLAQTENPDHVVDHDPSPVRTVARRSPTRTGTATPPAGRSSMCPNHTPSRSPNIAPIVVSAPPAAP